MIIFSLALQPAANEGCIWPVSPSILMLSINTRESWKKKNSKKSKQNNDWPKTAAKICKAGFYTYFILPVNKHHLRWSSLHSVFPVVESFNDSLLSRVFSSSCLLISKAYCVFLVLLHSTDSLLTFFNLTFALSTVSQSLYRKRVYMYISGHPPPWLMTNYTWKNFAGKVANILFRVCNF